MKRVQRLVKVTGLAVCLSAIGCSASGSAPGGSAPAGSANGGGGSSGSATSSSGSGSSGIGGSTSGSSGGTGGSTSGSSGSSGSSSSSGASGSDSGTATGPCDIYQTGNTPCVAAHSTVRALYGSYGGKLHQVTRADNATKDIPVLAAGGFADTAVQDSFCAGTSCTISIIYDQSPQHNDLLVSPKTAFMPNGGLGANATDGKITVGGHTVHGIYVTGEANFISARAPNVAYRNNKAKGIATGDQPEAMYMVLDGTRHTSTCCFDYGNAETSGNDDGNGTMEAIYWGSDTNWSLGVGTGPWVCGDLENGMYKGDVARGVSPPPASNTSVTGFSFVTAMLKGPSGNHFGLKAGNAQSGVLAVKWDGARPSPGYSPKRLEGAIILGTGGDGSSGGSGTFFEGCMTAGNPSDAIDDAVQANIVAAGYGR